MVPPTVWEPWFNGLQAAQAYVRAEALEMKGGTGRAGNPLGGSLNLYPNAACLIQDPRYSILKQYQGFCVLLLVSLILNASREGSAESFRSISTVLRRAATDIGTLRVRVLGNLPAFDPENAEQSLSNLEKEIDHQLDGVPNGREANQTRELLAALRRLVAPRIKRSGTGHSGNVGEGTTTEKPPAGEHGPTRPLHTPSEPVDTGGSRPPVSSEVDVEPEGGPKGPSTEPQDLRIRAQAKIEEEPLSREGLLAEARQIGAWFNSSSRRVPVDRSLLNPIERRLVSARLHEEIGEHGTECGAYLLALIYLTGLNLKSILESKTSSGGPLVDGIYRRKIIVPPDGFKPKNSGDAWVNPAQHVDLPLPPLIGDLLPRSNNPRSVTLGQALGMDETTAESLIGRELEILRKDGQYPGIHRQRIPAQLGAVLSAYEREPAITYYLAGGANPPALIYYDAIAPEILAEAYQRATAILLPTP